MSQIGWLVHKVTYDAVSNTTEVKFKLSYKL